MNFLKRWLNISRDTEMKEQNFFVFFFFCTQDRIRAWNGILTILLLPIINLEEKVNMDELFDEFFETLEFKFQREFSRYIVKISQVQGSSFYGLTKKPRGKILGDNLKQ